MKKIPILAVLLVLTLSAVAFASDPGPKRYKATGVVTRVNPLYAQITIQHDAIKGFMEDGLTDFYVEKKDLLKNIHSRDIVDFEVVDTRGDVRIDVIVKTGQAEETDVSLPIGRTVQGVIASAGEAVNTVSQPIAPAHEVIKGTLGAATGATGAVLNDADHEVSHKF